MPPSRCAVTIAGLSSSVTVHMPSAAWNTTSAAMALASARDCRVRQATRSKANSSRPSVPAS